MRRRSIHRGVPLGIALLSIAFTAAAPAYGRAGCQVAPQRGTTSLTLPSGGRSRSAMVHQPPGRAPTRRLPLVLALHGSAADGAFMERYSGLSAIADSEGFVAVYPNASRGWNADDSRAGAPNDVGFVSDLLDRVEGGWCIDTHRIYAVGVSSGGRMVARLACDLSDRLTGIASVAGSYGALPACRPSRPVSVLEVHGTSDRVVPYKGRAPGGLGSVPAFVRGWRTRDHCRKRAVRRPIAARTFQVDFSACARNSAVRHIEIVGGGHQYPGAMPPDAGPRSTISASRQAWRFFSGLRS